MQINLLVFYSKFEFQTIFLWDTCSSKLFRMHFILQTIINPLGNSIVLYPKDVSHFYSPYHDLHKRTILVRNCVFIPISTENLRSFGTKCQSIESASSHSREIIGLISRFDLRILKNNNNNNGTF